MRCHTVGVYLNLTQTPPTFYSFVGGRGGGGKTPNYVKRYSRLLLLYVAKRVKQLVDSFKSDCEGRGLWDTLFNSLPALQYYKLPSSFFTISSVNIMNIFIIFLTKLFK